MRKCIHCHGQGIDELGEECAACEGEGYEYLHEPVKTDEATTRERGKFEAWLTEPPYERSCVRHGYASAWPGHYLDYDVQLAWEAWQQAKT